jgi:Protein of unknown function (DUF4235)
VAQEAIHDIEEEAREHFEETAVSKGAKVAYRPVGLVGGLLAGTLSGIIFKQVWKLIAQEDDAPAALQSDYRMREVVLAAALQGAIFAGTKAAIERAGARGFTKLTGAWPGD